MVTLSKFLEGCRTNASRIKEYRTGCSGSNGLSDCIGFVIGALELAGVKWNGLHGSNFAARNRTRNLRRITSPSHLRLGDLIYKHYDPGTEAWRKSFPIARYKGHPDQNDYYHVGVVTSVSPLEISHCSGGGMHYDTKLGKWDYAGECTLVNYGNDAVAVPPIAETASESAVTGIGKAIVDVPDDTAVNVRSSASLSGAIRTKINEGTEVDVLSVSGS